MQHLNELGFGVRTVPLNALATAPASVFKCPAWGGSKLVDLATEISSKRHAPLRTAILSHCGDHPQRILAVWFVMPQPRRHAQQVRLC